MDLKSARGVVGVRQEGPMGVFKAIAALFRGLFSRREDDFKTLLMSDLGIER